MTGSGDPERGHQRGAGSGWWEATAATQGQRDPPVCGSPVGFWGPYPGRAISGPPFPPHWPLGVCVWGRIVGSRERGTRKGLGTCQQPLTAVCPTAHLCQLRPGGAERVHGLPQGPLLLHLLPAKGRGAGVKGQGSSCQGVRVDHDGICEGVCKWFLWL